MYSIHVLQIFLFQYNLSSVSFLLFDASNNSTFCYSNQCECSYIEFMFKAIWFQFQSMFYMHHIKIILLSFQRRHTNEIDERKETKKNANKIKSQNGNKSQTKHIFHLMNNTYAHIHTHIHYHFLQTQTLLLFFYRVNRTNSFLNVLLHRYMDF